MCHICKIPLHMYIYKICTKGQLAEWWFCWLVDSRRGFDPQGARPFAFCSFSLEERRCTGRQIRKLSGKHVGYGQAEKKRALSADTSAK